jgi:hypothetical protein
MASRLRRDNSALKPSTPYRPRTIRFLGVHARRHWRITLYGITTEDARPRSAVIDAAVDSLQTSLPDDDSLTHGVGFAIAHDAPDYCFVLVDWFARHNEIHQRMWSAPRDDPGALRPHPGPAIGCVWELAVTDFERRAWLTHVLANPRGRDLDAYVAAHFEGQV